MNTPQVLPIYIYGQPVLREVAQNITPDYPNLSELIANMFKTMYQASGVGLAAPQIGLPIRIFVVDGQPMEGREGRPESMQGFVKVFINPQIIEEKGEKWSFEEGCLSIPGIRNGVMRHEFVTIKYVDVDFKEHIETYSGIKARIIQHEHDHLEGKLFTDYASPLKKQLLKPKLQRILRGDVESDYPMVFHNGK